LLGGKRGKRGNLARGGGIKRVAEELSVKRRKWGGSHTNELSTSGFQSSKGLTWTHAEIHVGAQSLGVMGVTQLSGGMQRKKNRNKDEKGKVNLTKNL